MENNHERGIPFAPEEWDMGTSQFSTREKASQVKMVFKTKCVVDCSPMKYKARLVDKLFSQVQGIDYNDTFAPVANMDSIRLVLAIAASKHWEVHQMDVKSDFIHNYTKE